MTFIDRDRVQGIHAERVLAKMDVREATDALARLTLFVSIARARYRDAHLTPAEVEARWTAYDWAAERGLAPR